MALVVSLVITQGFLMGFIPPPSPALSAEELTQIFIDRDELRQNGHTLEEISEWILGLTKAETAQPGVTIPAGQADDLVFQAAFPSKIMGHLPCLPEARA